MVLTTSMPVVIGQIVFSIGCARMSRRKNNHYGMFRMITCSFDVSTSRRRDTNTCQQLVLETDVELSRSSSISEWGWLFISFISSSVEDRVDQERRRITQESSSIEAKLYHDPSMGHTSLLFFTALSRGNTSWTQTRRYLPSSLSTASGSASAMRRNRITDGTQLFSFRQSHN